MGDWHTHVITTTYAADVSGVCSAMFELGGMSIIHDPSGCNSTYTTHDEPRWYDSKSLMFCSGLDEMGAIMGDDSVVIKDAVAAIHDLHPRFVTLCGSSIPHVIGFDTVGVARLIEEQTGVPVLGVKTDGLKSYVSGVGKALDAWIARFADPKEAKIPGTVNLLGVTPLDFSTAENVSLLKQTFEENGWKVNGCFAMNDSFENLTHACRASVNVVVSSAGLIPAKKMKTRNRIPYVLGLPMGKAMTERVMNACEKAQQEGTNQSAYETYQDGSILIIGEEVFAASAAQSLRDQGLHAWSVSPDPDEGFDEETLGNLMNSADIVIGDPLFRVLWNEKPGKKFIDFPHEVCSGRIFRDSIPLFAGSSFELGRMLES